MTAETGTITTEDGRKLNKVEAIKLAKDGLDVWNDIFQYARADVTEPLESLLNPKDLETFQKSIPDAGNPEVIRSAARRAKIAEEDFVRFRWFGVYQQLPNLCHFMLRIRVPNGFLTTQQAREVANISRQHARGFADITTRQCFQLHWLTIEAIAEILPRLERVGLVSKFACGDTPRNVVGCPLAGYLQAEFIDASGVLDHVNQMFLKGNKEFSNLPRKFKSGVSGCHLHCHQPQINDIGIFGVKRVNPQTGQDERGYGVTVGGGLSSQPYIGQGLRVFIKPEQVPAVCRGIAHIFRDHGYREKRTRARMKYLVADWGWEKFRDYLEADIGFKLEHDDNIVAPEYAPHTDHLGSGPQKQPGLSYVGVPIERGRITADQLSAAAELAERFAGKDKARISLSNKQNLLFVNIPSEKVAEFSKELDAANLTPHAPLWRTNLISCTGTQFCNLAIVETKQRASRILKYLEENVRIDTPIMISVTGCPNSCAQYQIADIGLMGVVCNFRGQRGTEAYQILLGGALGEHAAFAKLAMKKVPAEYVHKSIGQIVEAYKTNRIDEEETFNQFVRRCTPEQLSHWLHIPEMAEVV
ncbi:MAG TPA: nitrite/sulfite reductase [Phycisphaerae bacterium]|nr:nitrite/sulfite reductase [Phycisphaerae bacterium]